MCESGVPIEESVLAFGSSVIRASAAAVRETALPNENVAEPGNPK